MTKVEKKPWGSYRIIEQGINFKIKQIILFPKMRTSLQFHKYRAEHMIVTNGSIDILVGNEIKKMSSGDYCYIEIGVSHRLQNNSKFPAYIIEIQFGEVLDENDITRIEDDFNRESID